MATSQTSGSGHGVPDEDVDEWYQENGDILYNALADTKTALDNVDFFLRTKKNNSALQWLGNVGSELQQVQKLCEGSGFVGKDRAISFIHNHAESMTREVDKVGDIKWWNKDQVIRILEVVDDEVSHLIDMFSEEGPTASRDRLARLVGRRLAMTIREAKLELAKLGIVLSKTEHGEFRVNFKGGSEKTAYYTNDLADAVGTARLMSKKQPHENRMPFLQKGDESWRWNSRNSSRLSFSRESAYKVEQLGDGSWVVEDEVGTLLDGPFKNKVDAIRVKKELDKGSVGEAGSKEEVNGLASRSSAYFPKGNLDEHIDAMVRKYKVSRERVEELMREYLNDVEEVEKDLALMSKATSHKAGRQVSDRSRSSASKRDHLIEILAQKYHVNFMQVRKLMMKHLDDIEAVEKELATRGEANRTETASRAIGFKKRSAGALDSDEFDEIITEIIDKLREEGVRNLNVHLIEKYLQDMGVPVKGQIAYNVLHEVQRELEYRKRRKERGSPQHQISSTDRFAASQALDRVSDHIEGLRREIPREASNLRGIALRLDRVANTLEEEQGVSERVSKVEEDLEGLGLEFTLGPTSSQNRRSADIFVYRGQLGRNEASVLGNLARKHGAVFDSPGSARAHRIIVPV